ncbi:bile acid:sodium symporter family protein [Zavarzinella formosa]|uniref:bile acid:sodium symporter family protein n=1 Tax=Zavarzinella formosa TaxID=360055 RepID=UPI00030D7ABB|nr:bile acid:sodium symporter [Zavarzinella formosa]
MKNDNHTIGRMAEFVHHYLLWFVIVAYGFAAFLPLPGLWLRHVNLGSVDCFGRHTELPLPAVLLTSLLFNAGLGVQPGRLVGLVRRPLILFGGLLGNLVVPLGFILGISLTLKFWHNPEEVQCILVGLALVASMPIAGSSTAWSQNANGDLALSLGLVVASTCLSPFTTPAVLHTVGWVANGTFADCLHQLAGNGTSSFLLTFVMLPSLAGIGVRAIVGEAALKPVKPVLKLVNSVVLLALCYSNAAVALPGTLANPDWDFLGVMLVVVAGLCVAGFVAGALLARLGRADDSRRMSLMYGLGMNNNGTGLVLAAGTLSHLPDVMLPIIFYNLVQHVVAGIAGRITSPRQTDVSAEKAAGDLAR